MDQAVKAGATAFGGRQTPVVPPAARQARDVTLIVANMRCGGCMASVEKALLAAPGVAARARQSRRQARDVRVRSSRAPTQRPLPPCWRTPAFTAAEVDAARPTAAEAQSADLLRRLGVAGFAAANVMLLSVSVWAGLASDMDAPVQALFHWLSALIALPTVAYSGQPFFRSARAGASRAALNMDVPISLGIMLASTMSLVQTVARRPPGLFRRRDHADVLPADRPLSRRSACGARKGAARNLMALTRDDRHRHRRGRHSRGVPTARGSSPACAPRRRRRAHSRRRPRRRRRERYR